jgi:FKBP-type peptidyl-prolyl cis-trans isomerase FkpA
MNKSLIVAVSSMLFLSACNEQPATETTTDNTATESTMNSTASSAESANMTLEQKRAYALGANSAGFLARSFPEFDEWGMSVDRELVKQGFIDMLEEKAVLSTEELQAILMGFQQEIQQKIASIEQEQLEKTNAANAAFMAEHAQREGVQITESGLQYRIIEEGTGPMPTVEDTVRVHYRGTLIDGTEFDSSYKRGATVDFGVSQVISGWQEGIQLVKEGGKIELVMGPELGYGERATPTIPANSALVFEVELVKVNPEPEPEAQPEEPSEG